MTEDKIEDKIAEIKARHKAGPLAQMPREDRMSNFLRWQWLLGEVDRRGAEIEKQGAEIKRLREEMQGAKADAWDDGYEAHRQMIDGIARKPSNPYR